MGIGAPIWFMIVWKTKTKKEGSRGWHQAPLAFLVPSGVGLFFGLSYWIHGNNKGGWTYDMKVGASAEMPKGFYYSRFLGTNLYGHLICIALFFIFFALHQLPFIAKHFPEVELEEDEIVIKADIVDAKHQPKTILDAVGADSEDKREQGADAEKKEQTSI